MFKLWGSAGEHFDARDDGENHGNDSATAAGEDGDEKHDEACRVLPYIEIMYTQTA